MNRKRPRHAPRITPGMIADTQQGDLSAHDIGQATVRDVHRDAEGRVADVVVEKGHIFKKDIVVPADRITTVLPPKGDAPGEVIINTNAVEMDGLSATGTETLGKQRAHRPYPDDILDAAEERLPTAQGQRQREGRQRLHAPPSPEAEAQAEVAEGKPGGVRRLLRVLGPGFLAGMAGNDASAVTSYSVNGATNGYGQLWLMLLSTPMFQAVQFTCAKVGRISQRGLSALLRERYGLAVAVPATLILVIANLGLIAGDLVAIGSGLELFTGIPWPWFVVPVALGLWYVTVFQNFDRIKQIFLVMSLAFISYLVTGFVSRPNWGAVLSATFIPHLGLGFVSISSAVALLGATVSPYTMFWQVQGEKEEQRPGPPRQQIKSAMLDIANGVISGNLVAYFIIVATSATLFVHHQQIATAADAARALAPLVGPYAKYLFAIGLIGAGLVAIPVLLASTAYAVSGTFGWTSSLWKKPWQNEGFYLILTVALALSLIVALLRFDPIQIMFWANVLQGLLSPALVILLIVVANDRRVMGKFRMQWLTNLFLGITAAVLLAALVFFFIGLAQGQG
jgi:NRAMP (natural resistance-associated macrophage protein)-like metal ion transporter